MMAPLSFYMTYIKVDIWQSEKWAVPKVGLQMPLTSGLLSGSLKFSALDSKKIQILSIIESGHV